jgi:Domain of unknown function (DUF4351)
MYSGLRPWTDPMLNRFLRQLPFLQKFQAKAQPQLMVQRLTRIIGPLSAAQQQQIQRLSPAQMTALAQAADDFSTPDDLATWLRSVGQSGN